MERITISLREDQLNLLDDAVEESYCARDLPRIDSRSELCRMLIDTGISSIDSGGELVSGDRGIVREDLIELIPETVILEHRREQLKQESKPLFRGSKISERFSDKADELFEGEHGSKATPQTIEQIAASYISELEDHRELSDLDDASVDRQIRAIRERVETYREEFADAEFAPSETMRSVPEEVEIGSQIKRLRSERERFLRSLKSKAETEQYSAPSDLLKALAYEHGVEPRAVEIVIDAVTPEGSQGRQALKNGSGVELPEEIKAIEDSDAIERALDDVDPSVGESADDGDLDHVPRNGASAQSATIELPPEELDKIEADGGDR